MNKANLFIVGEQKSGTTTLHSLLDQSSEVHMSSMKEIGYFCTDLHQESDKYHGGKQTWFPVRTSEQFHKYFLSASATKYRGESSTLYLYSRAAATNIHQYEPNAKIIAVFRDPATYLVSLHAQYIKESGEQIEDLHEALQAESARKEGLQMTNRVRTPSLLYYRDRIKYADNLARFLELFPKENVYVILAEEMRKDTAGTVKDLQSWLGIDQTEIDNNTRNESGVAKSRFLQKALNSPIVTRLKGIVLDILPAKYIGKATDLFHNLTRKKAAKSQISEELQKELRDLARSEVEKLQELFDKYEIPLEPKKVWGY